MLTAMKAPIAIFVLCACVKLLLYKAYKSTDFEVHRNWLAITHSLHYSEWYYESTSQWTLDYPPLFAGFEWLLSQVAVLVDPAIVQLHNLNYSAPSCVLFQRCSVVVSELVLLYAVIQYCSYKESIQEYPKEGIVQKRRIIISLQLLANCGLLLVDHIHFQYNGFLFGFLLLSITRVMQGHHIWGAIWFCLLLNLKHLFLYIAPAYFIYLFKHHCLKNDTGTGFCRRLFKFLFRFISLGLTLCVVLAAPLFPFKDHLWQVVVRLFPLKRGLTHSYWAPNMWALYNAVDIVINTVAKYTGMDIVASAGSMTSGLVGEMQPKVLPPVPVVATLALTVTVMLPGLWYYLFHKRSTPRDFLHLLILCAFASFLFGWHVHEKAVLMITLPYCLLAIEEKRFLRIYLVLSAAAHISLFPLLFTPAETPIKITMFVIFTTGSFLSLPAFVKESTESQTQDIPNTPVTPAPLKDLDTSKDANMLALTTRTTPLVSYVDATLLFLVLVTQVYYYGVHGVRGILAHLPFLPLLLTSVSCSLVVVWTWLLTYREFFRQPIKTTKLD